MAKETAEGGLAGRYANALFELAQEHKAVDAVSADLAALRRALDSSPDLTRLVRSPVFSSADHAKALKAVLSKMGSGELATKFILLLASKRRLSALTGIIKAFEKQVARARGETEAEVMALIQEAIQFHLEDLRLGGKPIPEPLSKSTFVEVGMAA